MCSRRQPVIDGLNDTAGRIRTSGTGKRTLTRLRRAKLLSEEILRRDRRASAGAGAFRGAAEDGKTGGVAGGARAAVRVSGRRAPRSCPLRYPEMAPLFQAMHHGCQAGRHQEALDGSLGADPSRRNEFYRYEEARRVRHGAGGARGSVRSALGKAGRDADQVRSGVHLKSSCFRYPRARAAAGGGGADAGGAGSRGSRMEDWKKSRYSRQQSLPAAPDARRCRRGGGDGRGERRPCRPERRRLPAHWPIAPTLADALHQAGEVGARAGAVRGGRGAPGGTATPVPAALFGSRVSAIAICCSPRAAPPRCASGRPDAIEVC